MPVLTQIWVVVKTDQCVFRVLQNKHIQAVSVNPVHPVIISSCNVKTESSFVFNLNEVVTKYAARSGNNVLWRHGGSDVKKGA